MTTATVATTDVSQEKIHQSRWGFHPCDQEFYLKLKFLHKIYWQTCHDVAAWYRWNRKEPHNRVIRKYEYNDKHQKIGSKVIGFQSEPKYFSGFTRDFYGKRIPDSNGIVELYHHARLPQQKPVKEFDESVFKLVNYLYDQAVKWDKKKK